MPTLKVWLDNRQNIASQADLLFCEGSPSCNHSRFNPSPDRSSMRSKCWSIKDVKYCASIFSYLSQVSTPLPWLIATIILATFPPVPALLPLAKHPCLRPSDFSTLYLWELALGPWSSSCKRRRFHRSKTLDCRSKHLEDNFLASSEQILLFSPSLLFLSFIFVFAHALVVSSLNSKEPSSLEKCSLCPVITRK